MDHNYLDHVALATGRLMGNLRSLEWMVRNVLYLVKHPPHTEMPQPRMLFDAKVGDTFPLNALTSYDSLAQLIAAYNATAATKIPVSLVTVRDTLAHGRTLGRDDSVTRLSLMKFTNPKHTETEVRVSVRCELTREWLDEQIALADEALGTVIARYRELGGT